MFRLLIFFSLLLVAARCFAAPNGTKLYEEHCSGCHRYLGEGGIGLPLNSSKMRKLPDDYLRKTIRLGRPGRVMPGFNFLSDAQVDAIIGHIREWTGPAENNLGTEPVVGNVESGDILFQERCAKCHASDGSGEGVGTGVTYSRERSFMVMPPSISNQGFLAAASDQLIRYTIVHGRSKTAMPAFGERLDEQQINDLVAFVRSFQTDEPVERPTPGIYPSYVVESPYDFETTLDNVHQALTGANFRIFPQRFLEQGLADEFSQNTRQVTVRFCNFKKLYRLINTEPRLGVILPCRITVLERDGKILLVAPNLLLLSNLFNNDELHAQSEVMDEMIRDILDEATL